MIPARHSKWAQALFHPYIMRLMRRHFHGFHLLGEVPEWPPQRTLFILPNHVSWWDGFFIHLLNERLWQRKPYLMMLEEQLSQHRFFARLGVFSVKTEGFAAAKSSLNYLRSVFTSHATGEIMFCLFPQGELRRPQVRPLGYKPGILWLLRQSPAPVEVVQLGIRIEYLEHQHADVFFEFQPLSFAAGHTPDLAEMDAAHATLLERMGGRILAGEQGRELLHGHASVSDRWLQWRRLWHRSEK